MLFEITHSSVRGEFDFAFVRGFYAGHDLEQRALARTIRANHPDALPRTDFEARAVEDGIRSEVLSYSRDV